jgi:hypothetical protein
VNAPVRATLRCYAELNDHLPREQRQRDLTFTFPETVPVRRLLEAAGVPPDEVELVLVDGASSGLDTPVSDGARVSLYPVFERFDVAPLLRLRRRPVRRVRFVCDAHLGKLARRLRLLGFDTLFGNDPGDAELVRIANAERRVLLTRDRALLRRRDATHALFVPQAPVARQLQLLIEGLHLERLAAPFTRCTCCNGELVPVEPSEVAGRVPPRVLGQQRRFWRCRGCGRIYWEGSHYRRMHALVDDLLGR